MMNAITIPSISPAPSLETAWEDARISFERFCLTAGIGALEQMLREDAERLAGPRHGRNPERAGRRWGAAKGKIGFHGGKVDVLRLRSAAGCKVFAADADRNKHPLGDFNGTIKHLLIELLGLDGFPLFFKKVIGYIAAHRQDHRN